MEITSIDKTNNYIKHGFRKAFIRNRTLSPEARLLLIDLMSYKGMKAECWPSQSKLSKDIGRNKDSIRKYLNELISNGFLVIRSRGIGRSLLYAPSYLKISTGYEGKSDYIEKPTEETIDQPTESTLNRSISLGNKDNTKIGKEGFDQQRKELGLI